MKNVNGRTAAISLPINALKLKGEWNKLDENKIELTALRAEVNALTKNKCTPKKQKEKTGSDDDTKDTKKGDKNKKKPKQDKNGKRIFSGAQAWRNKAPKKGESHTKTVKDVQWIYCPHHRYWAQHKPKDCQENPKTKKDTKPTIQASMAAVGIQCTTCNNDPTSGSDSDFK